MTLNFFLVGKSHASHFEEAYDYYKKKLLKYAKVNIIALKESKLPDKPFQSQIDKALEEESKTILNSIPKGSFLILMDLQGKELDSFEFSEKFKEISQSNVSISFVIGSSYGLSDNVRKKAGFLWKLSPLTFTHPLALEITLEQVYRSLKIINGETYQK